MKTKKNNLRLISDEEQCIDHIPCYLLVLPRAHFLEIAVYRRFRASATQATAIAEHVNTVTGNNNKWDLLTS